MTREEAIAFFKDMNECTYGNLEAVEMAIKALKQEPKIGYWIEGEVWEDTDGGWGRWQKCSVCRQSKHHKTNFCPHCGAKMVKPQESEG